MYAQPRVVRLLVCTALVLLASRSSVAGEDLVIDLGLGRGPVTIHVPPSYDPSVPTPLVLLLHGYCSDGDEQEAYMQFTPLADEHGFLYAHPDGLTDIVGCQYWNGTDACCDFFGDTNDSGYLQALIDEVKAQANVDDGRVFLIGHSNGGFMSYRMACDHPDTIAAIASLAGATHFEATDCLPASPVHTLQIHGTADETIEYDGGCFLPGICYPGAVETTEQWAAFNGCVVEPDTSLPPLDLDAGIAGDETLVSQYSSGCDPNGSSELWTIVGGSHVPNLSSDFSSLVIEFLLAHPKSNELVCEDIEGSLFACNGSSALKMGLFMTDFSHDGQTVTFEVDGVPHDVTVVGRKARLFLPGQSSGDHTLELTEPAGCFAPVTVTCN